jgi:molybdopterin converting factor small subunit
MITVLLFAQARLRAGCSQVCLEGSDLTLDEVWRRLLERHPPLVDLAGQFRWAVNGEYVPPGRAGLTVTSGDEVAIIPPVSGG